MVALNIPDRLSQSAHTIYTLVICSGVCWFSQCKKKIGSETFNGCFSLSCSISCVMKTHQIQTCLRQLFLLLSYLCQKKTPTSKLKMILYLCMWPNIDPKSILQSCQGVFLIRIIWPPEMAQCAETERFLFLNYSARLSRI